MSISSFVVYLPTLSLMALLAISAGIPHDNNMWDGLSPRSEWHAAPTLACKQVVAARILRPFRLGPRIDTLQVFGRRLLFIKRLLKCTFPLKVASRRLSK